MADTKGSAAPSPGGATNPTTNAPIGQRKLTADGRCGKCRRSGRLIDTKVGAVCKQCADHLPPYLRRVAPRKSRNISKGSAKTEIAASRMAESFTRKKGRRR